MCLRDLSTTSVGTSSSTNPVRQSGVLWKETNGLQHVFEGQSHEPYILDYALLFEHGEI